MGRTNDRRWTVAGREFKPDQPLASRAQPEHAVAARGDGGDVGGLLVRGTGCLQGESEETVPVWIVQVECRGGGADPQPTLGVNGQRTDVTVRQRGLIERVIPEDLECCSVEPVEAVLGAEPQETLGVLNSGGDEHLGQTVPHGQVPERDPFLAADRFGHAAGQQQNEPCAQSNPRAQAADISGAGCFHIKGIGCVLPSRVPSQINCGCVWLDQISASDARKAAGDSIRSKCRRGRGAKMDCSRRAVRIHWRQRRLTPRRARREGTNCFSGRVGVRADGGVGSRPGFGGLSHALQSG